jgi:glutamate racemase
MATPNAQILLFAEQKRVSIVASGLDSSDDFRRELTIKDEDSAKLVGWIERTVGSQNTARTVAHDEHLPWLTLDLLDFRSDGCHY